MKRKRLGQTIQFFDVTLPKDKQRRRPAKRRSNPELLDGLPTKSGLIQLTFFPVENPDLPGHKASRHREILEEDWQATAQRIESTVYSVLREYLRNDMPKLDGTKYWSGSGEERQVFTAKGSVLFQLVTEVTERAIAETLVQYKPLISQLVARLERQQEVLDQRRENGQILAPEGQAARKPATDKRADRICRLYSRIRPQHPAGRKGNGAALAAVANQFGPCQRGDKPISVKGIRGILKRCGVPCR